MIESVKGMTATATSPPSARAAESTIAAPFARALLDLAVERGADRTALVEAAGLDRSRLDDRDARIPVEQWVALVRLGAAACGDPALALHFGEAFDVGDMSVVGLIGRSAETKAEGLDLLNRFCRLVVDVPFRGTARFEVVPGEEGAWLVDTRLDPDATPEITEAGFAQIAAMGRRMLPGSEHFRAVHFTHPAPRHVGEYERIFGPKIVFASDRNAFLMPEGWERERIAVQPRYALDILAAHAETLLERLDASASLAGRVEALLDSGVAGTAAIAARLGLSERTLCRRLQAEGTSLAALQEQRRRKLALRQLGEGRRAKDIAYGLGYADPAAFSRAFKRWTGSSPTAWRRREGGS